MRERVGARLEIGAWRERLGTCPDGGSSGWGQARNKPIGHATIKVSGEAFTCSSLVRPRRCPLEVVNGGAFLLGPRLARSR